MQNNYDFLPDGYLDTLVMTETLDEIFADKCISLVNCTRYIRYRDIWDLHWLQQKGATLNASYIQKKIADYQISDYFKKLDVFSSNIDDIIYGKSFIQEMSRFIPMDVQERTLKKKHFLAFLREKIKTILSEVRKTVHSGTGT